MGTDLDRLIEKKRKADGESYDLKRIDLDNGKKEGLKWIFGADVVDNRRESSRLLRRVVRACEDAVEKRMRSYNEEFLTHGEDFQHQQLQVFREKVQRQLMHIVDEKKSFPKLRLLYREYVSKICSLEKIQARIFYLRSLKRNGMISSEYKWGC